MKFIDGHPLQTSLKSIKELAILTILATTLVFVPTTSEAKPADKLFTKTVTEDNQTHYTKHFQSGEVKYIQRYSKNGLHTTHYYKNGKIDKDIIYNSKLAKIKQTQHLENGMVEYVTIYIPNVFLSVESKKTFYYPTGEIKSVFDFNSKGVKIKHAEYAENKDTKYFILYQADGTKYHKTDYYPNGNIGRKTDYYPNGNKDFEIVYHQEGVEIGKINYNPDGTEEGRYRPTKK